MTTHNQDIEILKNFSSRSLTLNSYMHEGINILVPNAKPIYPLLESVLESSDTTNDIVSRKYTIYISDLVNKDLTNRINVISDTEQTGRDLLYYLRKIERDKTIKGFRVSKDIVMTDYTESGNDDVSGWFFEITISSHVGNYSCNLPVGTGTIFDENYIYIGGSTLPITNSTMFLTEDFIYGTDPLTLTHTPTAILTVFAGASIQFEGNDYTRVGKNFTMPYPPIELGDIIRITYAY